MIDHTTYPLQKADTGQYVYHLTYKSKRDSIMELTLKGYRDMKPISNRGLVFAHNTEQVSMNWYWMCLDIYEKQFCDEDEEHCAYRDQLRSFVNKHYDIWRIDNEIANKNWYVDQIGYNDCFGDIKKDYYIKCFGNIPKEALTLCCVDDAVLESVEIHNQTIIKTYYNQIIPREEYIVKHGFKPEIENVLRKVNSNLLELALNDEKGYLNKWKLLKNKNISLLKAA
jgi:hypothetical protein